MRTSTTIALALFILLATSCSKEKRIEKKLSRVGEWRISELNWMKVTEEVNDPEGELSVHLGVEQGSRANAGTMTFLSENEGLGSFNYEMDDGFVREGAMIWSVENETVSIADVQMNVVGLLIDLLGNSNEDPLNFSYEQELFAYSGERVGRNEFHLEGGGAIQVISDSSGFNVGQYAYTLEMTLVKP